MCSKGPSLRPSNTLWLFPLNVFFPLFFNIHKKCIWYQFKIFSQKYASNFFLTARSLDCSVSAKFFPMLEKTLYFGGIIIQKNLLKPWARLQVFFSLSSLAYKLMNLLVFEKKNHIKWARTDFFFYYWSGTELYLWI